MKKNYEELPNCLGNYIKGLREVKGLRLKEVAERSKVSPSYLNRLESGKRKFPSQLVLQKLANVFDITTLELLQMSLGIHEPVIKDIRDLLLGGLYNIKGLEVSKEMKILLCEIVESITSAEWQNENMSNVHYQKLTEIIKDLNKLL